MSQSDEDLMEAYVRGDGRAFETLFARWAPKLSAFFARALGHGATSDDVLQVTFLKIHAAKDTFRLGSPFRPWLYGIASRCRADELRKRYRTRKNVADGDLSDVQVASDAPDVGENNELVRRVRRAIEALPEAQRSVVLLHRYEGLTFGEIAEALSIAEGKPVQEGAVRVRAFRAYETLRAALADMRDGLGASPATNGERT